MIQFLHVSQRYDRGDPALSDVTLTIDAGEFVFLSGPSGAGKSTFLRLLLREESPREGRVLVAGRNIADFSEAEVMSYRRDVGFVFQDFRLLPRKTVSENLTFVLRALGTPATERRQRAFDALGRVGLQNRLHSFPRELSGGEQQRVAIARAILGKPRLLLADEPTGSLHAALSESILDLFREVNSGGTTMVVATHDLAMIGAARKRTIVLERGRVISDGLPR